jgi:hypothetical protein
MIDKHSRQIIQSISLQSSETPSRIPTKRMGLLSIGNCVWASVGAEISIISTRVWLSPHTSLLPLFLLPFSKFKFYNEFRKYLILNKYYIIDLILDAEHYYFQIIEHSSHHSNDFTPFHVCLGCRYRRVHIYLGRTGMFPLFVVVTHLLSFPSLLSPFSFLFFQRPSKSVLGSKFIHKTVHKA